MRLNPSGRYGPRIETAVERGVSEPDPLESLSFPPDLLLSRPACDKSLFSRHSVPIPLVKKSDLRDQSPPPLLQLAARLIPSRSRLAYSAVG